MEMDENATAHTHLKQLLLQQIESQEKVSVRYQKILKRMAYISFALYIAILVGVFFIIYSINKPETQINILRKEVKGLETRTSLQREYIEMDKKDLDSIHNLIDSLKKRK